MSTQSTTYAEIVPQTRKVSSESPGLADAVAAATPELKAKLQQMAESGKDRLVGWKDGFQDDIRAKPLQSVLIAAALGAVLGLILGRRS